MDKYCETICLLYYNIIINYLCSVEVLLIRKRNVLAGTNIRDSLKIAIHYLNSLERKKHYSRLPAERHSLSCRATFRYGRNVKE